MSELQYQYHERINLERFDNFYSDVAERDYNHHSVNAGIIPVRVPG